MKLSVYVDDINTHQVKDYMTWKNILQSSGGDLAPEKCNFYKISWSFQATGQPKIQPAVRGNIDNLVTSIPQHGAHKSLGYMMSPTQNSEHQVDQWTQQENKFIQILMTNTMSYYEVEVLNKHIYIPTMRYMMPFTNVKKGVIKRSHLNLQIFF